ncbi:uncharacterized protein UDID_18494 [Ustilago sp. UG-2017a]|nr:uncharacterized protein UDID_18494 [Ustilago sp. UG-2017a]
MPPLDPTAKHCIRIDPVKSAGSATQVPLECQKLEGLRVLAIYFFTPTFARQRGRWSDLSLRERSGSCHKEEATIDNHSAEKAKSTRPDHEHRVVSSCRSEIKRVTIDTDNPKTASACQHDMIEPVST